MDGTSATWLARLTTKSNRVASSKMRCSASPARNHAERVDSAVPSTIRQWLRLDCLSLGSHPFPETSKSRIRPSVSERESVCGIAETGTPSVRLRSVVVHAWKLGSISRVGVLDSLGLLRQLRCDELLLGLHNVY